VFQHDVVVMTQACDIEQDKVDNIVLCPLYPLSAYKESWEKEMRAKDQNPKPKVWSSRCEQIKNGYAWNLTMLNAGNAGEIAIEHSIVDFHEVFSVPRPFLDSLVAGRSEGRPSLLPPYREHLSQAFARFFMRVGLPVAMEKAW
jgi:hypothetical protein